MKYELSDELVTLIHKLALSINSELMEDDDVAADACSLILELSETLSLRVGE